MGTTVGVGSGCQSLGHCPSSGVGGPGGRGDQLPSPWPHCGSDHPSRVLGEADRPASSSVVLLSICHVPVTRSGWEGEDMHGPLQTNQAGLS